MSNRQDESRLLATIEASSTALGAWHALVTAPSGLRRRTVLDRLIMLSFRAVRRYTSQTPRLREIPTRLNPAERVVSVAMVFAVLAQLRSSLAPDRAEHRRKRREWSDQRARYRRLRYGWEREGFLGRVFLLARTVRLPNVAAPARWRAFSAGAAVAEGVIFYYTYTPQSELRKRFPRSPAAPISALYLLSPLLKLLGLLPSSLWIPWPVRLAARVILIPVATLTGTWGAWHLLRIALLSPERRQRQWEEFQRKWGPRRRKQAPKDRL